jgi:uncharacterized membrane protein YjjP (DUF1212 family)
MSDIEDLQIELENALDDIDELIAESKRYRYLKAVVWWSFGLTTGWLLCVLYMNW